jgi:hypothetical protein
MAAASRLRATNGTCSLLAVRWAWRPRIMPRIYAPSGRGGGLSCSPVPRGSQSTSPIQYRHTSSYTRRYYAAASCADGPLEAHTPSPCSIETTSTTEHSSSTTAAAAAADTTPTTTTAPIKPSPLVRLFTGSGCSLCDDAKDVLQSARVPHRLELVDIGADATYRRRYKWDIPVLHIDGRYFAKHRIDREGVERALLEATQGSFEAREGEPDSSGVSL